MPLALIVGAGIGGLAAAIALRRAGWDVRVFERAAELRELGFGVGLAPNGIAALRALGIAGHVVPHGVAPRSGDIRHADGRVIRSFTTLAVDERRDYLTMVMRPVLHGALLDAVGIDAVALNREAVSFETDETGVRLRFAEGAPETGDVLIGADGVGSRVRSRLHPGEPPPRPSGYFALRGASTAVERLQGRQAIFYLGHGFESGIVQAGPASIYWFLSVFADEVGAAETPAAVRERFAPRLDDQFRAVTSTSGPDAMRLDELFVRPPLSRWGTGRVTLLGDAAHPMLPHTGQGASQALEDAVALGRAFQRERHPAPALRSYEAVRTPRVRRIVDMGPRIARITTTRNPLIALLRTAALRAVPQTLLIRAFSEARRQSPREVAEDGRGR